MHDSTKHSTERLIRFLQELDGLKRVERRSYIHGGERLENSAEHSWHAALAAWTLANHLGRDVSLGKLLSLALIHDLGELDAGDTFLYSDTHDGAADRERDCITRITNQYPGLVPDLLRLWDEQQAGESDEARILKVADRLLPLLLNLASEGRTWREHNVNRSQVLAAHSFIAAEAPELFAWIQARLEEAVQSGWLEDA